MTDERLDWEEVQPAADRLAHAWTSGGDLRWMEDAWRRLAVAGLTEPDGTGLDRTRVAVRLLALGHLYWDWCASAFDETTDISWDLERAAADIKLSELFVGQLVGEHAFADSEEGNADLGLALHHLSSEERPAVVRTLVASYGSKSMLFVALWRSVGAEDPHDLEADDDWSILNTDLTTDKQKGFAWIEEGCPVVHGPS